MTQYTFSLDLLWSGPSGLQPWQSATLTLDIGTAPDVTGELTIAGTSAGPIPMTGQILSGGVQATSFTASGENGRWSAELSLSIGSDQIVYAGTYVGGLANILDPEQQEWLYYVVQGTSPEA
jgi:hypothetical protein